MKKSVLIVFAAFLPFVFDGCVLTSGASSSSSDSSAAKQTALNLLQESEKMPGIRKQAEIMFIMCFILTAR